MSGVKLRITPPPGPAACTSWRTAELASVTGSFVGKLLMGCLPPSRPFDATVGICRDGVRRGDDERLRARCGRAPARHRCRCSAGPCSTRRCSACRSTRPGRLRRSRCSPCTCSTSSCRALGEARVADDADDLVALDELLRERALLRRVELLVVSVYLIGRPLMPPLSLTQLKYASATLPIVVKSTPGMSMAMPPSLIGMPVAFLPVPLPQTLFVADAVPEPTGPAAPAPAVSAVSSNAVAAMVAPTTPILIVFDLIRSFSSDFSGVVGLNHEAVGAATGPPPPIRIWSRRRPPYVGYLPEGLPTSSCRVPVYGAPRTSVRRRSFRNSVGDDGVELRARGPPSSDPAKEAERGDAVSVRHPSACPHRRWHVPDTRPLS